ncbi:hypothetical protein [Aeromonas enteropelogenes]|uniref:Uncharacterized protein n=1 Tax=Aeromonas enteropelogenes TaxID=29489 RepID=A0ABU9J5B1_AEREN|nr:hypothetical protein [Aeromonas enteropelogenes]UBH51365.1 hypothetical protein LA321_15100 [Aeromonas enteropelogenes]
MWLSRKTDLQVYFTVNVGLHFVQHQPTIFSPTYEMEAVVTGRSLSPYSLLFILPLAGGIYQLIRPKRENLKTISVKQGAN